MSKQRRTADDFVRDMKAKQQHSAAGDRKTSEALTPETSRRVATRPTARPVPTAVARNSRSRRSVS
jgi:hypothetical protein